jgi:hypothetical protein
MENDFNLRKLNELEVRKQDQIEISNRFAAFENEVMVRAYGLGEPKPRLKRE